MKRQNGFLSRNGKQRVRSGHSTAPQKGALMLIKSIIKDINYIREAKQREAELTARLEESERRIEERRRAWYEAHGMSYYKG